MSLIIKGMKLPKNGEMKELTIGRAPNGSELIAIAHGDTTEFYKVVEIPTPHGRLIDADYINGSGLIEWQKSIVKAEISQAPTVVEAEVSEE